jgi:hypothetical protein
MNRCRGWWAVLLTAWLAGSPFARGSVVLSGVPNYQWYYGCAPTSGGALVGYWDGRPGYQNLFDGDASIETQATRDMIASPNHISDPYSVRHSANSIADFMQTDLAGNTDYAKIGTGLEHYIEWNSPNNPTKEGYDATVVTHNLNLLGGDLSWDLFKEEIDAQRPLLLNLIVYSGGDILGHTVVGYGYQDDMFHVAVIRDGQQVNLTLGGFAVRDTWSAGIAQSNWYGWDLSRVDPIVDTSGVEWWPWLEAQAVPIDPPRWNWMIYQGITVDIAVPEPTSACLLGLALLHTWLPRRGRRTQVTT